MSPTISRAIIVVAAGRGVRIGPGTPKQYRRIAGRTVLALTLEALARADVGAVLVAVIHGDDQERFSAAAAELPASLRAQLTPPVLGGASRQESVRAGLEALACSVSPPDLVAIHDGARPFIVQDPDGNSLVTSAFRMAERFGAGIPGLPITDTIKTVDDVERVIGSLDRRVLRSVQTPQAFRFTEILTAHRLAAEAGIGHLDDDAALIQWAGGPVHVFAGDPGNLKITNPGDLSAAEMRILVQLPDIRIGQGFDVHAFTAGDHVWLGGIQIDHDRALLGHSDADVVLHAITDAILGALGEADIGSHFPATDPQWRDAASHLFLRNAVHRVHRRGGMIAHLDATVICESPRIAPHRQAMRAAIAEITAVAIERISVKATTSEGLGFTGRSEGIAAAATATVRLPG